MNTSSCCNAEVQVRSSPPSFMSKVEARVCSSCLLILKIIYEDAYHDVEEFLSDDNIPLGFHCLQATTPKESAVHYVLSQLIYCAESSLGEVPYALPDPDDVVKLLWCDSKAVGFYTIKPLGPRSQLSYLDGSDLPTLDTALILPSYRRRGLGLSMLQDFVDSYPNIDLGVSYPISQAMWKVLKKFLGLNESMKRKFWLVKDDCGEGNKTLIWLCLGRSNF